MFFVASIEPACEIYLDCERRAELLLLLLLSDFQEPTPPISFLLLLCFIFKVLRVLRVLEVEYLRRTDLCEGIYIYIYIYIYKI